MNDKERQRCHKLEETKKTRPDQEDQSNTVDWILGQKNHLSGNPGEILKRSRI